MFKVSLLGRYGYGTRPTATCRHLPRSFLLRVPNHLLYTSAASHIVSLDWLFEITCLYFIIRHILPSLLTLAKTIPRARQQTNLSREKKKYIYSQWIPFYCCYNYVFQYMTSLFTLTLTSSHLIRQSNWLWRYRPFLYHLQRIPRHASTKNLYPSCYHMRIAPRTWLNQRQPCRIICPCQLRRLRIHWQMANPDSLRQAILTSGWLPVLLDVAKAQ